jgi:hypothetical protein
MGERSQPSGVRVKRMGWGDVKPALGSRRKAPSRRVVARWCVFEALPSPSAAAPASTFRHLAMG